jgi:type II secretion system protein D
MNLRTFTFLFAAALALAGGFIRGQGDDAAGFSNYQNTPVTSILDIYEQLSGKHLIRDANLVGVPNVSINATGLSRAEMLKLIESTLLLNGVALVPFDNQSVKVVKVDPSHNIRSEGVHIYADAAELPADDEVVSYYMPLSYITPEEAVTIFGAQAPVHPYGAYVPAPSAQAVILTESTGVIRQLIALRELIDVPPARVTSEFIQLSRADAGKVAETITDLLNRGPDSGPQIGVPGRPGEGGGQRGLIVGTAKVVADLRSNRLLVVSQPINMPYLRSLIASFDQPDRFVVPQRRNLRYVLAQDILPALEAALAEGKDEEDQAKVDEASLASRNNGSSPGASAAAPVSNASAANGAGGEGTVQPITPQLQAPPDRNLPSVASVGKTRILADNRSNSIIVFGSADATSRIFDLIDQLDHKPLQVYLATVIGELTVSEGQEFGIDILQNFQRIGSSGLAASNINTSGTTSSATVPNPATLLSAGGFPITEGLTLYGAIGSTLDYYVRALATTDRFKIISRPSVYTTNNKLAVIASGSEVPVPSNTTSGFTGSNNNLVTTSNIQYEDVLLQLDIIPLINADHQVTLKIRQTNNTLGASTEISGNSIPSINTQEINTEATVPDKSTVVIGGLISNSDTRDTSGVPLLSDIPILGYLFKDTKKSKTRTELIIMIQPTVVGSDADQVAVDEREKDRTILGREGASVVAPPLPPPPMEPDIKKVSAP